MCTVEVVCVYCGGGGCVLWRWCVSVRIVEGGVCECIVEGGVCTVKGGVCTVEVVCVSAL